MLLLFATSVIVAVVVATVAANDDDDDDDDVDCVIWSYSTLILLSCIEGVTMLLEDAGGTGSDASVPPRFVGVTMVAGGIGGDASVRLGNDDVSDRADV